MPRPPGRHAFVRREHIMELLYLGDRSADIKRLLRSVEHNTPDDRTVDWVCYHWQLMSKSMALNMLKAFDKYANISGISLPRNEIAPDFALVEFNTCVEGLGPQLSRVSSGMINADVDQVGDIATHVGTSRDVITAMASGLCTLVPEAFANRVAIGASQVLQLGAPLTTRRLPPNEVRLKPLGSNGLEQGKRSHQCPDTVSIRSQVVGWVHDNDPRYTEAA